jgi:hypothetical protein
LVLAYLWVLYICKVEELLVLELAVVWVGTDSGLPLVHEFTVPPDAGEVNETDTPADDDDDLRRLVSRSIFRLEGLRSDEITDTVANEIPVIDISIHSVLKCRAGLT